MALTILALVTVIALAWFLLRPRRGTGQLGATGYATPAGTDRDRVLAELRALPDAPADVETRLRI